ncbi:SUKH-3 domain-containing protein [Clostridium saccharoperbutylacetonicum]
MLLEETKKILKEAGWYEGRKIDISEHIKFLEDMGYEVFDALKKWLEEFGDLKIILEDEPFDDDNNYYTVEYSTCIKEIIGSYKKNINQDEKAEEKTIPVAEIANNEILVYISESGKFYTYEGLFDSNTDNFFNSTFAHDHCERPLTWIELGKDDHLDRYLEKSGQQK